MIIDFIASADGLPQALIVAAAVVTALGVLWKKAIVPVRDWFTHVKEWMNRTGTQLEWVDKQMRPNDGGSLVDKVNATIEKVDALTADVQLLLCHDAERDQAGRRYGPTKPNET